MNQTISIKNQKIPLEEPCIIIQGGITKDDVKEAAGFDLWFAQNQLDIFQKKEIPTTTLRSILSKLEKNGFKIGSSENLELLSKLFETSNEITNSIQDFQSKFTYLLSLLDLLKNTYIKNNLENELFWAKLIEDKSMKSVDSTRIKILEDDIQGLNKKIKEVEPEYKYLKERVEKANIEKNEYSKKTSELNKEYMNKTRDINNLSREIDSIVETINIYVEKIDDFSKQSKNKAELEKNEDYIRVIGKKNDLEAKIERLRTDKQRITNSNIQIKATISSIYADAEKGKKILVEIEPRFQKMNQNYADLNNQLKDKQTELDQIKNKIATENDGENKNTQSTLTRKKPDLVRYSKNIAQELQDIDSIIQKLSETLGLETKNNQNINHLQSLIQQKVNEISSDMDSKIVKKIPINDLIQVFTFFYKEIPNIESKLNLLLSDIELKVSLNNFPIKFNESEKNGKQLGTGQEIHVLNSKNDKEIDFEELPNYKKLFLVCSLEIAFNQQTKINRTLLFESDMDPKLYSKANIIKIIKIFDDIIKNSNEFKETRIALINSKLKIKEEELEGIKVFSFNDE